MRQLWRQVADADSVGRVSNEGNVIGMGIRLLISVMAGFGVGRVG